MRRWPLVALLIGIALAGLPGLDDPLWGPHHYRLTESAAMARNFYEGPLNILLPRVDWGGAGPGYVEEAFQLYTFLVAVLYRLFGPIEALGRALSLIAHVATAYVLFLLSRRLLGSRAALFAVLFFGLSPLGVYYGRSFQPDSLMLLCSVTAVYLFQRFTEDDGWLVFWGSAVALSAAVLMKPLNLYLGLPLLYLAFRRFRFSLIRRPALWLYAGMAFVPAMLWYVWAHQLWIEYGNTNGMWGQGFSMFGTRSVLLDPALYRVTLRRALLLITTLAGSGLLVLGLLLKRRNGGYLAHVWLIGFAVAFALTAGSQIGHDYYLMPPLVITALPMGAAADHLWDRRFEGLLVPAEWAPRLLVAVLCLVTGWETGVRFRDYDVVPRQQRVERSLAESLATHSEPGSLVVIGVGSRPSLSAERQRHRDPDGTFSALGPVELYHSRRRGWCLRFEDWSVERLEALRAKGATHFATWYLSGLEAAPELGEALAERFTLVERADRWVIYSLAPPG